MRILFIGDIVGRSGRAVVLERLPALIRDWKLDFVAINGENAAGGFGITEAIYQEFLDAGKPVLLYFSGKPVALESVDPDQWSRLQAFKKKCQSEGLISSYQSIEDLRELLRQHLGRTLESLKKKGGDQALDAEPPAGVYEQVSRNAALLSLRYDYEHFLKKALIEWSAERDSQPISILEAQSLLRDTSNGLIEFRSRVTNNTKLFSDLLADATRRLKVLQRHEVYLDGGASYMKFWQEGDDILELLEVGATALDDALQANPEERISLRQATAGEIEFNQQHLTRQEYSTPAILRTESVEKLLANNARLPERLLANLRVYQQNIRAARDIQTTTMGTPGDHTPELVKIEQLLTSAQTVGQQAIGDFALLQATLRSR